MLIPHDVFDNRVSIVTNHGQPTIATSVEDNSIHLQVSGPVGKSNADWHGKCGEG